jgi:hypothetical protein
VSMPTRGRGVGWSDGIVSCATTARLAACSYRGVVEDLEALVHEAQKAPVEDLGLAGHGPVAAAEVRRVGPGPRHVRQVPARGSDGHARAQKAHARVQAKRAGAFQE